MLNPEHSYMICATPRSGSTLLCDLLTEAGAGRPDSFFNFDAFDWPGYFNLSIANWGDKYEFDQSYLDAVLEYGTSSTSIFGMRLMWESLDHLSKRLDSLHPGLSNDNARFRVAFGGPIYLHLSREDKVAQAVSELIAGQTGLWHIWADGSERERLKPASASAYDYQALKRHVKMSQEHDAAWTKWFVDQDIEPIRITYEALVADPQGTLATVLPIFDLDPAIAKNISPKTAKLVDAKSCEWIDRFRAENANNCSTTQVNP